jgi:hypothetical protein
MNDKLKPSPFLITIQEQMPGKVMAHSVLDDEATANILMNLAVNFYRQSAIKKHETAKAKQGAILNPHTMQTIPKGN